MIYAPPLGPPRVLLDIPALKSSAGNAALDSSIRKLVDEGVASEVHYKEEHLDSKILDGTFIKILV